MSAQGPAPERIGKRKGAGGVGATNWELSERGSARTRCVLGWGVLTWRPGHAPSIQTARRGPTRGEYGGIGSGTARFWAPIGAH